MRHITHLPLIPPLKRHIFQHSCSCSAWLCWLTLWLWTGLLLGVELMPLWMSVAHVPRHPLLLLLSLSKRALLSYTGLKPCGASVIKDMTDVLYHYTTGAHIASLIC